MNLLTLLKSVNEILWGELLIFLLTGAGIVFTISLRFVQVRKIGEAFRDMFSGLTLTGNKAGAEGMSSFQALSTAIAAQVGTGNLAGVATQLRPAGRGLFYGCGWPLFLEWLLFL